MREIMDPFLGLRNPLLGLNPVYAINPMKGKAKTPKVAGFMRSVLAGNVVRLMDHHYPSQKTKTDKEKALAKAAGVSWSTVQRITGQKTGASLDNIEAVAEAFDLSVYQLMIPALEIDNPQIVEGAGENERRFYRVWRREKLGDKTETTT